MDLAQEALTPVQPRPGTPVTVESTAAGLAYQVGEITASSEGGVRMLWVPMLDGADRAVYCGSGSRPGCTTTRRCAAGAGR